MLRAKNIALILAVKGKDTFVTSNGLCAIRGTRPKLALANEGVEAAKEILTQNPQYSSLEIYKMPVQRSYRTPEGLHTSIGTRNTPSEEYYHCENKRVSVKDVDVSATIYTETSETTETRREGWISASMTRQYLLKDPVVDYFTVNSRGLKRKRAAIIMADNMTETRRNLLLDMYREFSLLTQGSEDSIKLKERIQRSLKLNDGVIPPRIVNPIEILDSFRRTVDSELYGLAQAKEEMLCFLNNQLTSDISGTILGLESSPGMGKTSLAISVAKARGCGWYKIPMGSITDVSQLTGSQPVYVGAAPGMIADALKTLNNGTGVLILDEADKINSDSRESSAIFSALLEILDFSQNHEFVDANLRIPMDLSRLTIIITMNDRTKINPIVLNRVQTIISLKTYSYSERLMILKKIMVPKYLKKYGLESTVSFTVSALHEILSLTPKNDKGMRPVENILKTVLSRIKLYHTCTVGNDMSLVNFTIKHFSTENFTVTPETVKVTAEHLSQKLPDSLRMMYS